MTDQRAAQQKKVQDDGATFWSSPSGDLSSHFDPYLLGKGLQHHDEAAERRCRQAMFANIVALSIHIATDMYSDENMLGIFLSKVQQSCFAIVGDTAVAFFGKTLF